MQYGKNRKGITKGPMHDMPEPKNLFRTRQEENVLGKAGLFLSDANGALEFQVARGDQTAERAQPGTDSGLL